MSDIMELDTQKMKEYVDSLEDNSKGITRLCEELERQMAIATQCMDQLSGFKAAKSLLQSAETIKNCLPANNEAGQRLILALKLIVETKGL